MLFRSVFVITSRSNSACRTFAEQLHQLMPAMQDHGRHLTIIDVDELRSLPTTFVFRDGTAHVMEGVHDMNSFVQETENMLTGGGKRGKRGKRGKKRAKTATQTTTAPAAPAEPHPADDAVPVVQPPPAAKSNIERTRVRLATAIAELEDRDAWKPSEAFVADVVARAEMNDGTEFGGRGTADKVHMYAMLINKTTRNVLALRVEVLQGSSLKATHLEPIEVTDHFMENTGGMQASDSLRSIFIERLGYTPAEHEKSLLDSLA